MPGLFLLYGGQMKCCKRLALLEDLMRSHQARTALSVDTQPAWVMHSTSDDRFAFGAVTHPSDGLTLWRAPEHSRCFVAVLGEVYRSKGDGAYEHVSAPELWARYRKLATSFWADLIGTYFIAIRDAENDRVVILNDRIGFFVHYFRRAPEGLIAIAPDATTLTRLGEGPVSVNPRGLRDLLQLGFITGEDTLLEDIQTVPPATVWSLGAKEEQVRYWYHWWRPRSRHAPAFSKHLGERLIEAVRVSVPPGADVLLPLSGGLDSRFIAWALGRLGARFRAVTFADVGDCEFQFARQVAQALGIPHERLPLAREHIWPILQATARINDGLHDPFYSFCLASVAAGVHTSNSTVLTGFLGETLAGQDLRPWHWLRHPRLCRGFMYATYLKSSFHLVTKCAPALGTELSDTVRSRIENTFPHRPARSAFALHELFEFEHRLRKLGVYAMRLVGTCARIRAPFLWPPLMDIFLELGMLDLFTERAYRRALCELWPLGRTIPFTWADLPPSAAAWRVALRRVGKPGRLSPVLHAIWKKLFWSPDHPGHPFHPERHLLDRSLPQIERFLISDGHVEAPYLSPDGVRHCIEAYRNGRREVGPLIRHLLAYTAWYASVA